MPYAWIQFAAAKQALLNRLANSTFWTNAEAGLYINEALRTWNSLTETWQIDFTFVSTSAQTWFDFSTSSFVLPNPPTNPRQRTLKDTDLYTMMEYHLMEPPTGGTWTGTSQFSITDLQDALQRRRDEVIQLTGCNLVQLSIPSSMTQTRLTIPDTVLEPRRLRFVPDAFFGLPVTLLREDTQAWQVFEPLVLGESAIPTAWSVATSPALAIDVNTAPNVPGTFDMIALQSGSPFAVPASTLLGVPDDFAWVVKFGALADLLSRDSEATDRQRAAYCASRYTEGIKIMQKSNWMLQGAVDGRLAEIVALDSLDRYEPEWERQVLWSTLVVAGTDFMAPCTVLATHGITATLIGNQPVPSADTEYLQIPRDVYDAVLGYALHLAAFKLGGTEFSDTVPLAKNFFDLAQKENKRLQNMALFADVLEEEGRQESLVVERY
jgi:hypothetical protein